jgi:DNA-binding winged helix-turn-helix (wHTH) protein/tetratricopeptide (TPR) repeat protein
LSVDPPTRAICNSRERRTIEPRVMRVLVALASEPGRVFSRDDLIELCWDGLIVGDNAINRVISLLRQILAELAGTEVKLETITKVGFRIVADQVGALSGDDKPADAAEAGERRQPTRRVLVAGGLGLGVLVAAGWFGRDRLLGRRPDPRAVELLHRAKLLQLTGEPGTAEQAISFYKQAVAVDPEYADGWGALALTYLLVFAGFSEREKASLPGQMVAAARKALALDPDQPDADAALSFSRPAFGDFSRFDAATAALIKRHPRYWYAHARRAQFLRDVGRTRDSIPFGMRSLEIDPMLPIGWSNNAVAFFNAGDIQESDAKFDAAAARWPAHGHLWNTRFEVLFESWRFEEAASLARNPQARPDYIPREVGERRAQLAEAAFAGDRAALGTIRSGMIEKLAQNPLAAQTYAPALAVMGFPDDALDGLVALFSAARRSPLVALQVATLVLFRPVMVSLRGDPRYTGLLRSSGLEEYWKRSGSQPDFRRN